MDIKELLTKVIDLGSSDLILKVGSPPLFRTFGELTNPGDLSKLTPEDTENFFKFIMTEKQLASFSKIPDLDFVYELEGTYRFRGNAFKQRGTLGLVFRRIPRQVPTVDELKLPDHVKDFAMRPRGLVLVTGPAGCGKSTTMASLVDFRNASEACHIITIEDPVEFLYHEKKAIINQRQVGRDTLSFAAALKHALRQDPDVIVIGDMRDLETMALALSAVETGHLVFANLHTTDAISTIDRIIDVFPSHQQQQIRMQVSVNLIGIVSQLLVKKNPGPGRVPAFEIMVATTAVRNMVRENKTYQLSQLMDTQSKQGMRSLNQSLTELVQDNITTAEQVLPLSPNQEELEKTLSITKPSPKPTPTAGAGLDSNSGWG
jgi:twitching motility protein PilT